MKISSQFIEMDIDVPVIQFKLENDIEFNAIIDTGSEQTIFDSDFVKNSNDGFSVYQTNLDFQVTGIASTQKEQTVSIVVTTLTVEDYKTGFTSSVKLSGIKMPIRHIAAYSKLHTISAIIGTDFLRQYSAKLDFKNKELMLNVDV